MKSKPVFWYSWISAAIWLGIYFAADKFTTGFADGASSGAEADATRTFPSSLADPRVIPDATPTPAGDPDGLELTASPTPRVAAAIATDPEENDPDEGICCYDDNDDFDYDDDDGYPSGDEYLKNAPIHGVSQAQPAPVVSGGGIRSRFMAAGYFSDMQTINDPSVSYAYFHFVSFKPNGTPDPTYNPQVYGFVNCLAVQPNHAFILGGSFQNVAGVGGFSEPHNYIARLNANATLDSAFNPKPNHAVWATAVQTDGKILFAGDFTTVQPPGVASPITRNHLARLNADGSLDNSFDPNANGSILTIIPQADGKILVAGGFSTLQPNGAPSPIPRAGIARLNSDGSFDSSFNVQITLGSIYPIALQADGKVLIAGTVPTPRRFFARVNSDGSLDNSFDPKPNNQVSSIVVQADGRIILGGSFSTFQPNSAPTATTRNFLARVNPDGTLDSLNPNPSSNVISLALEAAGKIEVSGNFRTFQPPDAASPISRPGIARLYNDPATESISLPDATQVVWQRGGAAPEINAAIFEVTTDGITWRSLGNASRIGTSSNWQVTGALLPPAGVLRATGTTTSGQYNGSAGAVQFYSLYSFARLAAAVNENGYLTITINKVAGVNYQVQTAGTLLSGLANSFSAATTTVLLDNVSTLKVRDNVPIGSAARRFIRAQVSTGN